MADGENGWSGDKKGGCMRKEAILLGEIASKEMSTVKGRWTNLMFTQRNNPYCDLLKNGHCVLADLRSKRLLFL